MKINAEIIKDSLSIKGDRLTTFKITFPRIILSEFNTHRMFSKNTSSSRAIPFEKMAEIVKNNPFIPIAWQRYHTGMQGNSYLDETELVSLKVALETFDYTLNKISTVVEPSLLREIKSKKNVFETYLQDKDYINEEKTIVDWWLLARDKALETASILYVLDVSKQLCNRILEPFMWTTMVFTTSEAGLKNFFSLRCPAYTDPFGFTYESKKEYLKNVADNAMLPEDGNWNHINKSQAEIHIQALAEKIFDLYKSNKPKQLQEGEWHIPFEEDYREKVVKYLKERGEDYYNEEIVKDILIKVSVSLCARISYTTVGKGSETSIEKHIDLFYQLINSIPKHSSPLEHIAQAMKKNEYYNFSKGEDGRRSHEHGWCYNFKGFKQLRYILE